jgi:hypothetical protein
MSALTSARASLLAALAALAALVTGALFASPAGAQQPPLSCGATITTSVRLTADLLECPGDGLIVGAPGIVIDLRGHTVDGVGTGNGISGNGFADVTVRNGTVRDFAFGVRMADAPGARITNMRVEDTRFGIELTDDGTTSALVAWNRVSNATQAGINVESLANGNIVRANEVSASHRGIAVQQSAERNTVELNHVHDNVLSGMRIQAPQSVVRLNLLRDNGQHGLELGLSAGDSQVRLNVALGNAGHGITAATPVLMSDGNVARNNQTDPQCVNVACL